MESGVPVPFLDGGVVSMEMKEPSLELAIGLQHEPAGDLRTNEQVQLQANLAIVSRPQTQVRQSLPGA